jgi:hypothetical protein
VEEPEEWVEHAHSLLKRAQKHSKGRCFVEPVDPEELGIPDYFDVIKQPMDFGTVAKKLTGNEYASQDDYAADMRLIFDNAFTYNQENDEVWRAAKTMSNFFEENWAKALAILNGEEAGDGSRALGSRTLSRALTSKSASASKSTTGCVVKGDLKQGMAYLKAVQESGWKGGAQLLLTKLQEDENAWPFMQSLPNAESSDKIKKHMDFPTIADRLANAHYIRGGRKEFLRDSRTVFDNVLKTHDEGSQLFAMAQKMSALFELEWASLMLILDRKDSAKLASEDGGAGASGCASKWEPHCEQLLERLQTGTKGQQLFKAFPPGAGASKILRQLYLGKNSEKVKVLVHLCC